MLGSEPLETVGADKVVELAQRNPENLQKKMEEVNKEKRLVRRVPVVVEVKRWVSQAKNLPREIKH